MLHSLLAWCDSLANILGVDPLMVLANLAMIEDYISTLNSKDPKPIILATIQVKVMSSFKCFWKNTMVWLVEYYA